jgi:hypothetical protein
MAVGSNKSIISVLLGVGMALATGSAGFAQRYANMSCDELWYARNQIYAEAGYCFKTAAALRVFGYRCYPPYGHLTRGEQRQVSEIQRWESRFGCN